jgi:hypothetical protein
MAEQTKPATPASGNGIWWFDSTSSLPFYLDDSGVFKGRSHNASIAAQGAGFAADTYVTNSDILIPSFGVQAKTIFRWTISASKTAAGTATPIYTVRIGANRTTADTSRLAITGPAQTAAADVGVLEIIVTVRTVGASGVIQGSTVWRHNGTATGFCNDYAGAVEATSSGFDNSALGGSYIGLSINGGTSAAWTLTQVRAEAGW